MNKKVADIFSLNQVEILTQDRDTVFNNPNKDKICSHEPLSEANKNTIINDFARRDEGSNLKKISDIITKDDALDVRRFYKRFDWDVERNSVSSIQGEAITYANSVDSIKSKIEAIVPKEFILSVSYLLQQGS